jgi:tRNA threonylcarbamoyladenosine modification (KEOPS) complex  Pcc1 subunit
MKAVIEVPFEGETLAKNAFKVLQGELTFKKRAKPEVKISGRTVVVTILADDIASLHAATGSFMRALKVILSVQSRK